MITFWRIIKAALTNFWRNSFLSIAATLVLSITLFTISVFVSLTLIGNATIKSVNARIDVIAYFKDEVSEDDIQTIEVELKKMPEVTAVEYVSKEKALDKFLGRTKDERLKKIVQERENPLPRSLGIKVKNPEDTKMLADYFSQDEVAAKVYRLRFNKEVIDKLIEYTSIFKKGGLMLVAIFIIISIFLVFNTIRLTIYARKDEIEIMKLVGATVSYIRWPFLVEGMLFGLISAVISSGIILLGSKYLVFSGFVTPTSFSEFLHFLGPEASKYFAGNAFKIVLYQAIIGIFLSVTCSYIATWKYLKL